MDITYRVIDENGRTVRTGEQTIADADMVNAIVVYKGLADLPVGVYTIQPGAIHLDVHPCHPRARAHSRTP